MRERIYSVPQAENEPVKNYSPGSSERINLKRAIEEARSKTIEIPMFIGGEEVRTGNLVEIRPPHDISHLLGHYHMGDETHVKSAIEAALSAKTKWMNMDWRHRASVFLKAASLLAGPYRAKINAATMLAQSKNAFQAEIDSACELIDFFRFNVEFMAEIYSSQPKSDTTTWNRLQARPLEGFVFALTPFNFTSIAGNLPTAPAIMGNTVVWKPSRNQIYSAQVIMEILREAGLPDGVINMVFAPGQVVGNTILSHSEFAGIHFTGSTEVFQDIWKTIGNNIAIYKTYPRIVGETGGKDFVIVHESADIQQTVTALVRGAFGYQGQKCSAASRAYIPSNFWKVFKNEYLAAVKLIKTGPIEDFSNFMNAVIDEKAFDKLTGYIDQAKKDPGVEIFAGGMYNKTKGYFIEPTVLLTEDPHYKTMVEELFGPVLTLYIYDENKFEETLDLVDNTSIYGLTGAIMGRDRGALEKATDRLIYSAGNFYINDKPTGAVVGQQPFGGSRGSGTNDKAGSMLNLLRWVTPRSIKENFNPPENFMYPFMDEK
ncbi:MAG: L-glutamate gamma-semialdehyde dehydrogenase [Bacteroidales bacterium]|nr:L-glutamate gamma-semialdehyde dehydrogenase [Bacteroidales bacterium]